MCHVAGTRDKDEGMSVTQDKVRLVAFGQRQRGGNINDVVLLYSRTSEAFCFGAETMRREYLMILPSYIAGQGRLVAVGQKQRGGNIYL